MIKKIIISLCIMWTVPSFGAHVGTQPTVIVAPSQEIPESSVTAFPSKRTARKHRNKRKHIHSKACVVRNRVTTVARIAIVSACVALGAVVGVMAVLFTPCLV